MLTYHHLCRIFSVVEVLSLEIQFLMYKFFSFINSNILIENFLIHRTLCTFKHNSNRIKRKIQYYERPRTTREKSCAMVGTLLFCLVKCFFFLMIFFLLLFQKMKTLPSRRFSNVPRRNNSITVISSN